MTAACIADDNDERDTLKALLTLAASGLAAEVVDGSKREDAVVHLGRLLGRGPGTVVLSCRGHEVAHRWPDDWQRAVADYARAVESGDPVTARRDDARGVPA